MALLLKNKNFLNLRRFFSTIEFNDSFVDVFSKSSEFHVEYRKLEPLSKSLIKSNGQSSLNRLYIPSDILVDLSKIAFTEIMYFLRSNHLSQLEKIYNDPESSSNDKFVAVQLLKNACVASARILPGCQDTGTAIVMAKKGGGIDSSNDHKSISLGVYKAYTENKFRYSQMSPLDMYNEVGTGCNLPAQIDIFATDGLEYDFLFIAKGGGSANKTFLYQETRAILDPAKLKPFLVQKISTIGTSACPPYHLAIVIGGLSAEMTLKTVKLASCKELDNLPESGSNFGTAFRDVELENELLLECQKLGIGAQFGGKYFCHDIRVVRLPRHGASCPIGIGVSCSADRQIKAKINETGVYLEQLEENPARYLPDADLKGPSLKIDLNKPMKEILKSLSDVKVSTRITLSGPLLVARDLAHQRLDKHLTEQGDLPDWFKAHPIYYAGPAKKPDGYPSGSFGPTTAGRMDSYADRFMSKGASLITLAKGNRSRAFAKACKDYGGFYLGSVGGPAALLAKECIKSVEVAAFPELGMEAVYKIYVEDFPAFVVVDSNGEDFYKKWSGP